MSEPHQHVFVFDGRGLWTCACGEQMNELAMILPPPPVAPPLTAGPVAPPSDVLGDEASLTWRSVALLIGEQLAANGPIGYYGFTPKEWWQWALNALGEAPRGAPAMTPIEERRRRRMSHEDHD